MLLCKYCKKECKNKNSLAQHEIRCKHNPDRISTTFMSNENQIKLAALRKKLGYQNQYAKAKALGLPKPVCTKETRKKLSEAIVNRPKDFTRAVSRKISQTIIKKVECGEWHTSLAKNMHYDYKGEDLHGKWELAYARWLDEQNIIWIRNKKSFTYIFENVQRGYTPDFYLPQTDEYIEIKGYETSKDYAKWEQFPKKLKVLKYSELKQLNII